MLPSWRIQTSPTSPSGTGSPVSGSTIFISMPRIGLPAERSRPGSAPSPWSSGGRVVPAPHVSVIPYTWKKLQPNCSIDFTSTSSVMGEAP